ncbi:TIGR02117 family protein [Hoeflea sp.]|uniref:TIGR02117 family protein n=1 Tax=Hoeflea sp. TaxID=1940281 RepID=UPI003A8F590F
MASGSARRWTRRFPAFCLGLIGLIALSIGLGILIPRPFFASAPVKTAYAAASVDNPRRTVLILSNAIHTDIAMPATPDVVERFSFLAENGLDPAQSGVANIIVGWGGRSFYIETPTWSALKPGPVFKALTVDRSVMHVSVAGPIDRQNASVTAVELDEASFQRMLQALLAGFLLDDGGKPVVVAAANYGAYDLFFEAEGWFNAIVGCNVWTAAILRQAGLKTGWWTPLPQLLSLSLDLHNPDHRFGYSPAAR